LPDIEIQEDRPLDGPPNRPIANAIVKLLHEYTGRGPTNARAYIHDDLITVVLQDSLTMGERSLIREGKTDVVLAARTAFQEVMGPRMILAVERHTGRSVRAFVSANHLDPDIAVETFLLAPADREAVEAPQ
jgi:uncharacterized protein YbcI